MTDKHENNTDITTSINAAAAIAVLLPENPKYHAVAAALSLYLALKETGKNVQITCPTEITVEMNRLVGVNKIKTSLPDQNLVISFDYVRDAIEKVSYNVEDGKFNLVVQPKAGHSPLSADSVTYSQKGPIIDLAILVDTTSSTQIPDVPQSLSLVKSHNQTLVAETRQLISQAKLPVTKDIAANLFKGLTHETQQFTAAGAPDFELAAWLVKTGANPTDAPQPKESTLIKPTELNQSSSKDDWVGPKIYRSGEVG